MSNIYSQFPKEPKSPDNEVASDYFFDSPITNALIEELKKPCDWDRKDMVSLCREFERELAEKTNEVARLREENEQLTDLFEYYYNCFDEADVERMDLEEEVERLREGAKNWHQHYRDEASKAQKCKQAFIEQEKEVARLRELLDGALLALERAIKKIPKGSTVVPYEDALWKIRKELKQITKCNQ
jgi:predicted RNase H-like nuclease (RuvC/YqgF family)